MDDTGRLLQYDEGMGETEQSDLPSTAPATKRSGKAPVVVKRPESWHSKRESLHRSEGLAEYNADDVETSLDTVILDTEVGALCGAPDGEGDSSVERVAVSTTKHDQNCLIGSTILLTYIGVWVLGALAVPVGLLLLVFQQWIAAGVLLGLSAVAWLVPLRPFPKLRSALLQKFAKYFTECSLCYEHVPNPEADRPTVFAVTPHGVFSLAWALCYLSDEFTHVWFCFSNLLRLNPWLRALTECLGHPSGVSKKIVLGHMKERRSIAIIPGAWHEATIHNLHADRAWIMKRRGFVKYALQHGYTITPIYSFGERETYWNPSGCYPFRLWLNDRKIMAIIPYGRWWCPLLPRPCRLHVVVGAPLQLPWIEEPTMSEVAFWHAAYVRAIDDLFNRHKVRCYGPQAENVSLEIW